MTQNSTRRGLAWAAAVALVGSFFGAMPAQADENISLTPIKGTSTSTFVTEEFTLVAATLNSTADSSVGKLTYLVEKTSTVGVVAWSADSTTSADIAAGSSGNTINAASTSVAVIPTSSRAVAGYKNIFSLKLVDATTSSASVDVKVTAFIDNDLDGVVDSGEANAVVTVSFLKLSAVTANVALTDVLTGDAKVKATGSLSGVNTDQLADTLKIAFSDSASVQNVTIVGGSASATVTALDAAETVSAQVVYSTSAAVYVLGTAVTKTAAAKTTTAVTWSPVKSDNVKASGSGSVSSRINSAFVLNVKTVTNSTAVANIAATVTMDSYVAAEALSSTTYIKVNGVKVTKSADVALVDLALTTGADGTAAVTVETVGFGSESTTFSLTVTAQNFTSKVEILLAKPDFTVALPAEAIQSGMGSTTALAYTVKDQWGKSSARTNQQLAFTVTNPTGGTSTLASVPVTSGVASANFVAAPSTVSGTFKVYAELQEADPDTGVFSALNGSTNVTVSIIVSSSTAVFSTKPVASYSASISYGAAMSWSEVAASAVKVSLGGASVVASNPDVIFFYDDATFSGTVTLPSDASGNLPAFKMASRKAGKHTVSFTVGATTSTALLVVDAAAGDAGKTITFDKTTLVAGETAKITGTLVDANGNAVYTSGSADVVVAWSGKGLPFGTGTIETDADGQFSINVLVLSSETGTGTITATYRPAGDATSTKNVTATQVLTIGAAAPVASADQKLTIGTFNGYIAIYAKGYTGQKLSYKVAGKWGTVASLSAFQRVVRKTGAGYEIAVVLYIDGVKVKTETVTTK